MSVSTNQVEFPYLIDQKLGNSLLLDINDILAEDLLSAVTLIGIETRSHDLCIGP